MSKIDHHKVMRSGNSDYLTVNKVERFNQDSSFLINFQKALRESLTMQKEGNFDPKKLHRRFKIRSINPKELLRVSALLSPKVYLDVQDILIELTGKPWPFNSIIDLLCKYFIHIYTVRRPVNKPFIPGKNFDRFQNLRLFNKKFNKYYKNIMNEFDFDFEEYEDIKKAQENK